MFIMETIVVFGLEIWVVVSLWFAVERGTIRLQTATLVGATFVGAGIVGWLALKRRDKQREQKLVARPTRFTFDKDESSAKENHYGLETTLDLKFEHGQELREIGLGAKQFSIGVAACGGLSGLRSHGGRPSKLRRVGTWTSSRQKNLNL